MVEDDKATVYGQVESTAAKEKVILIVGNTEGIATVDDRISVINPEPEATFYEVKKGDSLSKIAQEHYGDMMKYPVIFEANKPMLTYLLSRSGIFVISQYLILKPKNLK